MATDQEDAGGSEEMDEEQVDEQCRVITEVAVQKAMNQCGSERAVRKQLQRIVGLEVDDDWDDNCDQTLNKGLTMSVLKNGRRTREWVMCRSWQLVSEEEMSISAATERAWAEARAEGEQKGIEV